MTNKFQRSNLLILCFYLLVAIVFTYPIWSHNGHPFRYDWSWPIFDMREFWLRLSPNSQVASGLIAIVSRNIILLLGLPGLFNISPIWCLKIFMILIHTAAGYGFYLFISSRIKSRLVAIISGLVYTFTPYVFIRTIVGFILFLLAYAILPYFLNLYFVKNKRIGQYILLGLLLSLIFSQTQAGLLTLLLAGVYSLVSSIANRDHKAQLKNSFFTLLFWLLFVAPWIVIVLVGSRNTSPFIPDAHEATTLSFIAALPHGLKMMLMTTDHHITRDYFAPLAEKPWVEISYLVFYLVGLSSIFNAKNRLLAITALISLVVILPLATGPVGHFGPVFTWVYNHFSSIAVFRETYHFQFLIAFSAVLIFALGADTILTVLYRRGRRVLALGVGMVMLVATIPWLYPYFSFNYAGYLSLQKIPPPYHELRQFLKSNSSSCTKIFYPPGLGFVSFKNDPLKHIGAANSDNIAQAIGISYLDQGASVLNLPNADTYYRNEVVSQFYEPSDSGEFAALVTESRIDCVVVRTDIVTEYANASNLNRETDPAIRAKWLNEDYLGLMRNKKNFTEVASFGDTIYIFKPTVDSIANVNEDHNDVEPFSVPRSPFSILRLPLTDWANDSSYFRDGWTRGRYDFWYKHLFTQLRQELVFTNKDNAALPGQTKERGNYDLWIRYLDGGTPGQMRIDVDAASFEVTKAAGDEKFVWRKLGGVDLVAGEITIVNTTGLNAIADLVLIPT